MYHYLLFDWDGCLVNSLPLWMNAYHQVFKNLDLFPTDNEILHYVLGDWNGPLKLGVTDIKAFNCAVVEIMNEAMLKAPLHENVRETLHMLKREGHKIAIVTNSNRMTVIPALHHHGIWELVDVFLGEEDVVHYKPHPEVLVKAIQRLGGNREEALIIGDSDKDMLAGKNAEIASALFYPSANHYFYDQDFVDALNPDYLLSDFRKLVEIATA